MDTFSTVLINERAAPLQRQTTVIQGRKVSLAASVLNVMNAIMGSGILALPSVMAACGMGVYIGLQLVTMVIVDFSLNLLITSCHTANVYSYEELGVVAFGTVGKVAVCISILLQNIGAVLSYLIVVGDLLPSILTDTSGVDIAWPPPAPPAGAPPLPPSPPHPPPLSPPPTVDVPLWEQRTFLMCVATGAVILPLAALPKIGFLSYGSFVCFASMVLLAVLATYEYTQISCGPWAAAAGGCAADGHVKFAWADVGMQTAQAIPVLCFSFVCHTAFLPVISELREGDALARRPRPQSRVQSVAHLAIGLSGAVYLWAAIFGYLTFGASVNGNLWLSYSSIDPGDTLVNVVRVFFLAAILCTVPIVFFPMRKTLLALLRPEAPFSWPVHLLTTLVLLGGLLGVAIAVPQIKIVFAFVGATSSVSLVFILPGTHTREKPQDAPDFRAPPRAHPLTRPALERHAGKRPSSCAPCRPSGHPAPLARWRGACSSSGHA